MKLRTFIYISFIAFLSVACRTFSYLTVDVTVPSKEELPSGIQSLTLVNRAADKHFTDDSSDSIQLRFYKTQFNLDTVIYDKKSSDTLLMALGNLLFESGRYDIVVPEDRFLMNDSLNLYSSPMDWLQVKKLNKTFNTDAVLSLDYYKTSVSAEFYYNSYLDKMRYETFQLYHAIMKIGYVAHFRVYYPQNKEFNNSFLISDTLLWDSVDFIIKNLFQHFTSVKKALSEAGIEAALKLTGKIAPTWKSTRRAYFSKGHRLLRETKPLVAQNDWQNAMDLWKELLELDVSKSLKSKLQFNMALACEMQGDLNEAIQWAVKSYETRYNPVTYAYLNTLKNRKLLLSKSNEKN